MGSVAEARLGMLACRMTVRSFHVLSSPTLCLRRPSCAAHPYLQIRTMKRETHRVSLKRVARDEQPRLKWGMGIVMGITHEFARVRVMSGPALCWWRPSCAGQGKDAASLETARHLLRGYGMF